MATSVDLRLYGILDPARSRGRDLARLAADAVAGGVTILQYRDKHGSTRSMVANAMAIGAAIAGAGVPLLINDRIDVALAAGSDGVHVGRDDMLPPMARQLLGPGAIIGLTIKNSADIADVPAGVADYLCIGGVFDTASKDNPAGPIGLDGLRRLSAEARQKVPGLPVGAIAGIDDTNAASVIAAGADGVAVISVLFMADDVAAATRHIRGIVDAALAGEVTR